MSRKAKRAAQAKKKAPAPAAGPAPSSTAIEAPAVEPIAAGTVEWIWFIGASLVVAGVGLWFQLDVNRVFDVPKAVVLKVGGCGLFVTWLLYALFGPGVRWRSARVFAAPVAAMTVAVIISTLLSVDMATSFNGVYERQFGLQGFLACVGLFFLTATSISGQRGAWVGLGVLAIVGSSIGIYSYFQANGWDPYPFFWNRPHDKVYAFLGNATFAGNALALIMPIITVAASVAAAVTIGSRERRKEAPIYGVLWLAGLIGVLLLQIMPGRVQALEILSLPTVPRMPPPSIASAFKLGLFGGPLLLLGAALLGSWGPDATRLGSRKGQQAADAFGAGALAAMAVGIAMGLVFTRTRGALVGTGVALIAGLVLMPWLAVGTRWAKQVTAACWGTLAVGFIAFAVYVVTPAAVCGPKAKNKCWLYAETFRSIPAAFDPGRKQTGKGQGTRRYLWLESPRVLYNHTATLQRYYDDRVDYAKHVDDAFATRFGVEYRQPYGSSFMSFDRAWRTVGVWFFGIGIETYRYAFMSHKSMRLESLDPMTNHDNPHNNYLYVLASFGLVGLAAYVWLLWSLLSTAFRRFIASERPLLSLDDTPDNGRRTGADLVTEWRFEEADRKPKGKLLLVTKHPDEVRAAIAAEQPVWLVQVQADGLVIRGHDPDTAIERLARVKTSIGGTRADRALAFGIVISFFSYSVYSIAGFDSVACSVFLFFLLGTSAAMFRSNLGETPQNLVTHIRRQWAAFRKLNEADVPKAVPMPLRVGAAVLTVPLLLACVWQATVAYRAERALVGAKVPCEDPARAVPAQGQQCRGRGPSEPLRELLQAEPRQRVR